ncbi:hypothetical protein AB1K83_12520 [Sporosarcina sp. 179-K 3D1 HS]|uniref:hypothetical protein n=1 Tax=Sporosarcina sp. 179-K 3D1 HS TaxID=3232169 RepID=UPI0039A2AAC2
MAIIITILVIVFFVPIISFLFSGLVLVLGGGVLLVEKTWYIWMALILLVIGAITYKNVNNMIRKRKARLDRENGAKVIEQISKNGIGIGELIERIDYKKIRSCISHKTFNEFGSLKITMELDSSNLKRLVTTRNKTVKQILGSWDPDLERITYHISNTKYGKNERVRDIQLYMRKANSNEVFSLIEQYLPKDAIKLEKAFKRDGKVYHLYKSRVLEKVHNNDINDSDYLSEIIGDNRKGMVVVIMNSNVSYSSGYQVSLESF